MLSNLSNEGEMYARYADSIGDGSGTKQVIDDFSGAVTDFLLTPPENTLFKVARVIVHYEFTGNFTAANYGSGAALANGISIVRLEDGIVIDDYTDGIPIISNGNWGQPCYDSEPESIGAGNSYWRVRWSFDKSGVPVKLYNQSLAIRVNDDFTARNLVSQTFNFQGEKF